jgi:hypothetical protein
MVTGMEERAGAHRNSGSTLRRQGCSGGRRRVWRGPATLVWKGKERFHSNSGNGEARRALTGEVARRRRSDRVRRGGEAPVAKSQRGGRPVGGEACVALGRGRVRQTTHGREEFGWRAAGSLPTGERRLAGSGPNPAGTCDVRRGRAAGRTEGKGVRLTGGPWQQCRAAVTLMGGARRAVGGGERGASGVLARVGRPEKKKGVVEPR